MTVGTNGTGYVVVIPVSGICSDGIQPGIPLARVTNSLYTGVDIDICVAGTWAVGTSTVQAASVFSQSSLGTKRQYRLVGSGVRVSYTGTLLNRSGSYALWRASTRGTWYDSLLVADLISDPMTTLVPVSSKPVSVCYRASEPDDLQYLTMTEHREANSTILNQTVPEQQLIVAVTGAEPGTTHQVEIVNFYEVVGSGLQTTSANSDTVGMAAVMVSTPQKPSEKSASQQYRESAHKALSYLWELGRPALTNFVRKRLDPTGEMEL